MKKIAALLLSVLSVSSYANDVASMSNQAGGLIILTDAKAPTEVCKNSLIYYTTDANGGDRSYGCYAISKPWVYAIDALGKFHQWPMNNFELTDYATAKYGSK